MSFHIELRMIASTTVVVQFSPVHRLLGRSGWSESAKRGVTHVTGGSVPFPMSEMRSSTGRTCRCHCALSLMCRMAS